MIENALNLNLCIYLYVSIKVRGFSAECSDIHWEYCMYPSEVSKGLLEHEHCDTTTIHLKTRSLLSGYTHSPDNARQRDDLQPTLKGDSTGHFHSTPNNQAWWCLRLPLTLLKQGKQEELQTLPSLSSQ